MRHASNQILRRGFTLVEILVVVAIIGILIAILIPFMGRARNRADIAAAMSQLGGLQGALQQYYSDLGMYPPSAQTTVGYGSNTFPGGIVNGRGSMMLAQDLTGFLSYKDDGAGPTNSDGLYGFRTRQSNMGGQIYGPYASTDPHTFKGNVFIDPWGNEILYFRSAQASAAIAGITLPTPTLIFGLSTASPTNAMFFYDDCSMTAAGPVPNPTAAPATFFQLFTPGKTNAYAGGAVTGSDSYLLISAGPDGIYFTGDDIVVGKP